MKRAISIMLVVAMCMSLFGSAVLAAPSKVQIHIDGDKPEGTVKVSVGDAIAETGESNGEHITIDRDPGELEGLVGETVVVTEEDGDVFEGVLEQRGNGNDNDDENGTDNYWVTLKKHETEEPEAEYVPIDVDYDCEDDCVALTDDDDYADHENCEVEKFDGHEHHYFAKVGDTLDENVELYKRENGEFISVGTPLSIAKFEKHDFCQACTVDENDHYDRGDDEVGVYGAAIENGKKYDLDMDYHAGNGGNIPPVNNADAIQVIMSDGVKEMYNDLKGAKWVHVENNSSIKDYYEMGPNLWNDNTYNCTEDDITGVTMSSAWIGSPKLHFSMDSDNGVFAKVEVSYGKTYNPADPAHVGKEYDTMFLYCQLVSERDGEVDPEPQEMAYTVTAHYYEVRNGVESFIGTESYDGTYYGEEGESIRAEVNSYNTYGGRTYEFDADNENNVETIQISKDSSKNQFVLYYEIVIEEKDITVNYVDTEGNEVADSNTVTVDKNTDTAEWANEERSEIPETIMKDGDKYVKVDVIVDGDTVTVVYEKQEEQTKVDAIQVIMSDGVREMYEDLSVLEAGRYTHVDNVKSIKGYYEMGMNLWNDNSYNCTVEDVTGVSMGKNLNDAVMYFPMDKDNGIFAKVEVSYGKTYHPADVFHLFGTYDTMFLYCQLVSERDGEVEPETADYTVKANYLTLDENGKIIESASNIEVAKGTAEVGSTVTVNPDEYTEYNGKTYTFHSAAAGTSVVIVKGTNEIVLNYNRTEQATADMVNYKIVAHYKTNLANGTSVTDTAEFVMQGKVGMDVVADPNNYKTYGGVEYALDADNVGNTPDFTITVDEDSAKNIITINYERDEQPTADMVDYKVVAHYKTNLANGTSVTETAEFVMQGKVGMDVTVDPDNYNTYNGVVYALDADNYGNTPDFTITINEDFRRNIITINYERDEVVPETADYKVKANYLTLDENGKIIESASNIEVAKGTAEVGSTVTVNPDEYTNYNGKTYTFHSAAAGTSVVIVKGTNEIVLNYNRTEQATADMVNYKIVAHYKTNLANGTSVTETASFVMQGKVGMDVVVDPNNYKTYGGVEYTLDADNVGNTPDFTITVDEDFTKNIITINYERDEQAAEKAEYKVVANYLTLDENGKITDSAANVVVDSGEAEVGSTVTVDPAKYTVYDGKAYNFHSAGVSTSIVITAGTNEIVLNYNRTVDGGSGNPDEVNYKVMAYYTTTVNGVDGTTVSVIIKEGTGKVGDVITIDPADYLKNGGFEFTLDKDNPGNTEGFTITLGENSNLNILNVNYIRDISDDGTNPGGGDGDGDGEDITDPEVPGTDPEIPGDGDGEDITDPEVPGTDPEIPGDGEDITDPEVPTTDPNLPKTGGITGFALLAAGLAATAAGVVIRKR